MDEMDIPIDINTNKLLDWLISRRHVAKDWQTHILKVREKINNAIQDMPAHEGIIKLLSGQHINYFHCLKIIEILKETEADTKNLFGRYGSQRMKDWQDIVSSYQKDNLYLAEVAQMLIRNVSYEIPGIRKQITKLEQTQVESEKKIKEYNKTEGIASKEFSQSCEQLGIPGKNIKKELLGLVQELPKTYERLAENMKNLKSAIKLYEEFIIFASASKVDSEVLGILKYVIDKGNTTTFEYKYGKAPNKIEEKEEMDLKGVEEQPDNKNDNEIDFGEGEIHFGNGEQIDFSNGEQIDFSNGEQIDFGDLSPESDGIDWSTSEDGFEIINVEESGIEVEKNEEDDVARGDEAFTVLDNPKTRDEIVDCLLELDSFIEMRLYETSSVSDILTMSQMEDASNIMQMQTIESLTEISNTIHVVLNDLTNKRITHLHNIKHSPKYVDILTGKLTQKLDTIEKMKASKILLEKKIKELAEEIKSYENILKQIIENTKLLQKDIQEDISKKYKGRIVNIVGGVNML